MNTLESTIEAINALEGVPGLSLPEIAQVLNLGYDEEENVIVVDETIYADDGNCEVEFPGCTRTEAGEKYVSEGNWPDIDKTGWINISTYKKGIGLDRLGFAEEKEYGYKDIDVTLEPKEPKCVDGQEHDWRSPYSVLGGLKENPGVWGHGAGIICKEVCAHCGKYKISDSWAQNPENGQQGLESVAYEDADDDSTAWVERIHSTVVAR